MSIVSKFLVCAVLAWPALFVSCGDDTGTSEGDAGAVADTGGSGSDAGGGEREKGPGEFVADFETSPQFFTQMTGFVEGLSPHKKVWIWYSKDLEDHVTLEAFTAHEGSVAIKKFDNDGTEGVDGIVVMVRKPAGYDPDNGDWEYQVRSPDGVVVNGQDGNPMQGKIEMCITCHTNFKATGYLGGTKIK